MSRFQDQVVFITGASSGIGEALAREFVRQGARVALAARRVDRLEALARELAQTGPQALCLLCDVTRDGDLEEAVARTVAHFGRLDVVVANAGFGVFGKVADLSLEDFRRQFETNVYGVLRTAKAALPHLAPTQGRLALVGSVHGYVPLAGLAPYVMSKFAVRGLSETLDSELAGTGISVTHVAPGVIETEIRQVDNQGRHHPNVADPIPAWIRMPAPRAARQIVRGIARRAPEVVITGHGKLGVWLQRHLPGIMRLLTRAVGRRNLTDPRAVLAP